MGPRSKCTAPRAEHHQQHRRSANKLARWLYVNFTQIASFSLDLKVRSPEVIANARHFCIGLSKLAGGFSLCCMSY